MNSTHYYKSIHTLQQRHTKYSPLMSIVIFSLVLFYIVLLHCVSGTMYCSGRAQGEFCVLLQLTLLAS